MSDYSELKRLAWRAQFGGEWYKPEYPAVRGIAFIADREFISAASPAAVLALIAENEGYAAQSKRDSVELNHLCKARDRARAACDQLRAEVEALRKDAERYRWLLQNWFTMSSDYKAGVSFQTGLYRWSDLSNGCVTEAIDAAIAKESGQ